MRVKTVVASALVAVAVVVVRAQAPRQVSLLVANGIVVTVDGSNRILNPGRLAVDGGNIVAVDTPENIRRQFRARETIDAAGQVVMPGLVNTHTHAPMVLFPGLAAALAPEAWLTKHT